MNSKFLYVRNEWKKRNITILSETYTDGDKKFVKFAWAFCHNKDKFIKREGRNIVRERLENMDPDYSGVIEVSDFKFYIIAASMLDIIYVAENTPKKFLTDIDEDMFYYNQLSLGRPTFTSIFKQVDKEVS